MIETRTKTVGWDPEAKTITGDGPLMVAVEVRIRDGRHEIASLYVMADDSSPVTCAHLRSLSTPDLLAAAVEASDVEVVSDDVVLQTAWVYSTAWSFGAPNPTASVREWWGRRGRAISRRTAARWVEQARGCGYLTPTAERVAGGELTQKAWDLIA